jgi:hypothetical protein
MTMRRVLRSTAPLVVAAVGLLIGSAAVLAYPVPGSTLTVSSAPGTCNPGATCPVTFQAKDASGNPITGENVCFTISGPVGGSVSPLCGLTDPGFVTTNYTAGTGSTCGTETVTATAQAPSTGTAAATITVPCTGAATLPATSATPPSPSPFVYVLIALGVLAVLAGAIALRRTRPAAAV